MKTILEIKGLSKSYGARKAVEGLDLAVAEGQLYGFLGPNGAGKTTTIRLLLGFLRPDRGTAQVFGRDAWRESRAVKAETGYLPGDLRLPPWLSGLDGLRISGGIRGTDLSARGRELADLTALAAAPISTPKPAVQLTCLARLRRKSVSPAVP